ncbi:histidine kinase [Aquicoccus porphyridii]|uniref:Histidine kinase n=1 Tax=Aquicoccus porphyridii TaxID=1852029 RepID=A0A5A9Z4H3_9RHOB|nr:DUF6446 family protein [Aquicoccus porphyridii]KAA0912096.1 histidine kinase [Aquicoccus porphyridii]RAI53049.1 histidine kinase [Rhodobacteraceae bacterium AsT-22]
MSGKIIAGFIVIVSLIAGAAIYYLQVYAYYEEVTPIGTGDVMLTTMTTGAPEPIVYDEFRAINADSSPIRYRACFTTTLGLDALRTSYERYDGAEPRVAPHWFSCFDAKEIGRALETGAAHAFMGTSNIEYGIDRVVAVMPDGRGFVWHQINHCGEVVFDGRPAPEDCPPKEQGN